MGVAQIPQTLPQCQLLIRSRGAAMFPNANPFHRHDLTENRLESHAYRYRFLDLTDNHDL